MTIFLDDSVNRVTTDRFGCFGSRLGQALLVQTGYTALTTDRYTLPNNSVDDDEVERALQKCHSDISSFSISTTAEYEIHITFLYGQKYLLITVIYSRSR